MFKPSKAQKAMLESNEYVQIVDRYSGKKYSLYLIDRIEELLKYLIKVESSGDSLVSTAEIRDKLKSIIDGGNNDKPTD